MAFHIDPQFLACFFYIILWIPFDSLGQSIVTFDWCIFFQYVENETFLDGLLHRVAVEGPTLHLTAFRVRYAEHVERLVLRRRREGEVARVWQHLPLFDDAIDLVLCRFLLLFVRLTERSTDCGCSAAALAAVGFVDDDREVAAAMLFADAVQDEREGLHRADNELLAVSQEFCELLGLRNTGPFLHRSNDTAHLCEAFDRFADLLVQDSAVGDHNDGVKYLFVAFSNTDELMGQPGDAVGLPAACRMLD